MLKSIVDAIKTDNPNYLRPILKTYGLDREAFEKILSESPKTELGWFPTTMNFILTHQPVFIDFEIKLKPELERGSGSVRPLIHALTLNMSTLAPIMSELNPDTVKAYHAYLGLALQSQLKSKNNLKQWLKAMNAECFSFHWKAGRFMSEHDTQASRARIHRAFDLVLNNELESTAKSKALAKLPYTSLATLGYHLDVALAACVLNKELKSFRVIIENLYAYALPHLIPKTLHWLFEHDNVTFIRAYLYFLRHQSKCCPTSLLIQLLERDQSRIVMEALHGAMYLNGELMSSKAMHQYSAQSCMELLRYAMAHQHHLLCILILKESCLMSTMTLVEKRRLLLDFIESGNKQCVDLLVNQSKLIPEEKAMLIAWARVMTPSIIDTLLNKCENKTRVLGMSIYFHARLVRADFSLEAYESKVDFDAAFICMRKCLTASNFYTAIFLLNEPIMVAALLKMNEPLSTGVHGLDELQIQHMLRRAKSEMTKKDYRKALLRIYARNHLKIYTIHLHHLNPNDAPLKHPRTEVEDWLWIHEKSHHSYSLRPTITPSFAHHTQASKEVNHSHDVTALGVIRGHTP